MVGLLQCPYSIYSFFVGYLLWIQSTNRLKMASIVFLGHILVISFLLFTYFTSGMVAQKMFLPWLSVPHFGR
ncbi:MAG: hypothetical protein IPH52_17145 [Leptospiraceae bacterium]|nr:hypothetical protein [Leptospiraceae bacterium]